MAPAEIWQGGHIVNKIEGRQTHVGKLYGEGIVVKATSREVEIVNRSGNEKTIIPFGNSITLDTGEIVKSVKT